MLLDDTCGDAGMRKEGRHVKMVVSLDEDGKWGEVRADGFITFFLTYAKASWFLKPAASFRRRRAGRAIFSSVASA